MKRFTPQIKSTSVNFVTNFSVLRQFCFHTWESTLNQLQNIIVKLVARFLENLFIWRSMRGYIQVKNHLDAKPARKHSHDQATLKNMKEFIVEKSHLNAKHVRKHFHTHKFWNCMRESTQEKNHIYAKLARNHFHLLKT